MRGILIFEHNFFAIEDLVILMTLKA